jgi:hypothetical protein
VKTYRPITASGLLDDVEDLHQVVGDALGLGAAVAPDLLGLDLLEGEHRAAVLRVDLDHVAEQRVALRHELVAEQHHERVVADVLLGDRYGVSQAQGLALAHVVDVRQLGEVHHLGPLVVLARLVQVVLELELPVEVVLDGALRAAGDDQDVVDAGGHGFLDHVLDGRLVHDGQHLLGLRLRGRQEAGAEASGRDHGLADGGTWSAHVGQSRAGSSGRLRRTA